MGQIRVRYAPSPTGNLHIGGARTALFNYLFAQKHNGVFVLRIEDTDLKRNIENGERSQIENLNWLGISPDESAWKPGNYGPYRQSQRLPFYQKYAKQLLARQMAYYCFCTKADLAKERAKQLKTGRLNYQYSQKCFKLDLATITKFHAENKPFSIRLKTPHHHNFQWQDLVRGLVTIEGKEMGDWIIIKENGIPTYNFAVVIDDHLMEISHVFRGEEHLSNTPKQIFLYQIFNWPIPHFAHLTLITNEQGKKLSKRDESIMQFISQYKANGFLPEAILNFLALLGWSPPGEAEIFTQDQLINLFTVDRLSKSPSFFDNKKLGWINGYYLKKLPPATYLQAVLPFVEKAYPEVDFRLPAPKMILALYQNELSYSHQIIAKIKFFFSPFEIAQEAKTFLYQSQYLLLQKLWQKHQQTTKWTPAGIKDLINLLKKESGLKGKNLFMPLRIMVSGQMHGPELATTIHLLGAEKVAERMGYEY